MVRDAVALPGCDEGRICEGAAVLGLARPPSIAVPRRDFAKRISEHPLEDGDPHPLLYEGPAPQNAPILKEIRAGENPQPCPSSGAHTGQA